MRLNNKWNWIPECEKAFTKPKYMPTSDMLPPHCNPNPSIIVAKDASNYGVSIIISHVFPDGAERAVAHASWIFTTPGKNCSKIEKEALAIIFAVIRFHNFPYGQHFTLLMDEIPDVLLSMYRTTPHQASNDRSSAETRMVRKSRMVHSVLLPMDSTFPSSSSCVKKTLATDTAV